MRAGGYTEGKLERHSGLPAEVSSLVGRGPQIAAVLEGLRATRVLTLTGPGGCGKTRLALRAAALAASRFDDGAWLVELARAAAGQEGLALALTGWTMSAITGAGIRPDTLAALDEAANLLAAHPDRFAEMIMRHLRAMLFATLGQLEAAETEVGLCWAVGRSGALRGVPAVASRAEARLAAAKGDTAAAIGALRRAADDGRRVAIAMFVPANLADLACLAAATGDRSTAAAAVGEARAALGGRHQAITAAALTCAEAVMAWHRGEFAEAERMAREATVQWHRCRNRMGACDGIEFLGVLAAAAQAAAQDRRPPA